MTNPSRPRISPLALVLSLSAIFFVIFLAVSAVFFLKGGGSRGNELFGQGSVAVIEVDGVIMDSKRTLERIEDFREDPTVKALVVRINSPGGAVAPSQEIFQALRKFGKKPVVASMGTVAASGGYYIAVGADKIYANPGTITGSIGVIMEFVNLKDLYQWAKVQRTSIKTGKFKDIGAEYRSMSDEERALLQVMVDDVLNQFKTAIVEGRKLPMEEVTTLADGRIFSGQQAKESKLVDELGTLDDAIQEAAKMAKIKGKPDVIYPKSKKPRLLQFLLDEQFNEEASGRGVGWVEVALQKLLGSSLGPQVSGLDLPLPPGVYWLWRGGY